MALAADALEQAMMRGRTPAAGVDGVWVLDDGRAGHTNQSLGVAEALGVAEPEVIEVRPRRLPWGLGWAWGLLPLRMAVARLPEGVPPTVVIAAGSRNSRVLRWLKRRYRHVFAVQILKPRAPYGDYDVVVMPQHDHPPQRDNVCITTGALNRVTAARLKVEAERWEQRLKHCRLPRLAVLVGGASRHGKFGVAEAEALAREVLEAAGKNSYSLLVTTSRRSGKAVTEALRRSLLRQEAVPVHFWQPDEPGSRDNPYFAYLALAQGVVVTGESISMISEAATAGKPVYVWGTGSRLPAKFRRFLEVMARQGRAKPWDGRLGMRPPAAGMMDTLLVAGFIKARLRLRAQL